MYKEFYGFTVYPFTLTPDPQFLYPRENYKDCLFYLLHGLTREYGLLVMIGDIGVGKTFLLHMLIKQFDEKTHAAFIANPTINSFEILQYASKELHLEITGQSKAELLLNLKDFLFTQAMTNEKVVLIIDEAQNLSIEVLEELRLLTNFENAEKKLLQIILVGQPQLDEILKRPELTQLRQRVGFSCRLLPMNYDETKAYIEQRLSVAGVTYPIFTSRAIKEVFERARGLPREVNMICDFALLFGFIDETREIGHTIIQQVMEQLNLYVPAKLLHRRPRPKRATRGVHLTRFRRRTGLALAAALAAVSLLGAWLIRDPSFMSKTLKAYMTQSAQSPPEGLPPSPALREPPLIPHGPALPKSPPSTR